jgi:amidohydrolase
VLIAAHIVTALQTLISREKDPVTPGVISVGSIHAGVAYNVIPDTARLGGTIRAVDEAVFEALRKGVARVARKTAEAFGGKATVKLGHAQYPPLLNDARAVAYARKVLQDPDESGGFLDLDRPSMAAEDFAYYTQVVPGAMLWLGHAPPEGHGAEPLHSARFCFNDALIPRAVRIWTQLATRFGAWEA